MGTFELGFACRMADGSIATLIRTIAAPNLSWALRIGFAMTDEFVAPGQRLDHFVYAIPALEVGNRAAEFTLGMPRLLSYAQLWERILPMLGLRPDQVKWVYSWHIGLEGKEPEIVGFFPWPTEEVRNG